jgi:hypothetical protein
MIQSIDFAGPTYTGSIELGPRSVTLFAAPSDPDAEPHMATLTIDPTPDHADVIADAIREWAALARARERSNSNQLDLLALLP